MTLNPQTIATLYNIDKWSDSYFSINQQGDVEVHPHANQLSINLVELCEHINQQGLTWPVLVRFSDILQHRLQTLKNEFAQAISYYDYQNSYTPVYPIKVNQQRQVINSLIQDSDAGLEVGSKPELLIALGMAPRDTLIVCNGYKDPEYIRLALIAQQTGHQVYIIIEKFSEIDHILAQAKNLQVTPRLGVRVRLSSIAKGKWQNTGGEKSKFGLLAGQIFQLIDRLKAVNGVHYLQLLHCHLGSQIANIRDIQRGMREVSRFYAELRNLGVPIECLDVGGGLAIDYEGTGSRNYHSMNYSIADYAKHIVMAINEVITAENLPAPRIITESGRALAAHHAILLVNIIGQESIDSIKNFPIAKSNELPSVLTGLQEALENISEKTMMEIYHESEQYLKEAYTMFSLGIISLEQRAIAEALYFKILNNIQPLLDYNKRSHRDIYDSLNDKLAVKYFCNFSIFQSLPDIWAINQVFPIMPITNLQSPATHRGRLHDLTCDSDGCINQYVDTHGIESSLALPTFKEQDPNLLAVFLVGAYQEILGDIHNLFGDTSSVNVEMLKHGKYRLSNIHQGDSVETVLNQVQFTKQEMLESYRQKLAETALTSTKQSEYLQILEDGLAGYTYLED